jgi:soluble lytic murein transglycosylase
MSYLLKMPMVKNNLFYGLMAYNAGPGNLQRWKKDLKTTDPLLFMESVPFGETRAYTERVLANFWIYRLRLGQPTPCLEQVLSGAWPHYVPVDNTSETGV